MPSVRSRTGSWLAPTSARGGRPTAGASRWCRVRPPTSRTSRSSPGPGPAPSRACRSSRWRACSASSPVRKARLDPVRGAGKWRIRPSRATLVTVRPDASSCDLTAAMARGKRAESRREAVRGQVAVEERRVLVRHLRDEPRQCAFVARLQDDGAGHGRRRRDRAEPRRPAGDQRLGREDSHACRGGGAGTRGRDREADQCQQRRCCERSHPENLLHVPLLDETAVAAHLGAARPDL